MARPQKEPLVFMGDFETTVYPGQTYTEVWAAALVKLYTEDVKIHTSLADHFRYIIDTNENCIVYYHNLKFDGEFWMSYLLSNGYKQAYEKYGEGETELKWLKKMDMPIKSFRYSITDRGQWYNIIIRYAKNRTIEIRDSYKLLPFSVKRIGESFGTKHRKKEIEYVGFRQAGGLITDEERDYIKNDVLVVKEALEIMFNEGHSKLTIGSCCLDEFKSGFSTGFYKSFFPNLYEIGIDESLYGQPNAGEWIRRSYKGGWCYLVPGKAQKVYKNGFTADVNSLYPSVMHSESGNKYPVGAPVFWSGDYIPSEAIDQRSYYFIRIRTRFKIKEGRLPCIQIKGNPRYKPTAWLETSDIYDKRDKTYYQYYKGFDGNTYEAKVTLTLTETDYRLIREQYELIDLEILDGCYFMAEIGLFDDYIDKYREMKLTSTGARRELAKLFLNNLYGKMSSSVDSSFKVGLLDGEGVVRYFNVTEKEKEPGYIAIGSAITSYARDFTIRAAQANYHGPNEPGFIYADTDSIHCDLCVKNAKGLIFHDKNFNCWKIESVWATGYFVRQKTYIEVDDNDGKMDMIIKCAGMPGKCKDLFKRSLAGDKAGPTDSAGETAFLEKKRKLTDFKPGLQVPGKLVPKRIPGGVVLQDTMYTLHDYYGGY